MSAILQGFIPRCWLLVCCALGVLHAGSVAASLGYPDRIALLPQGDGSRSYSITWRTGTGLEKPVVEIAVATPSPMFQALQITGLSRDLASAEESAISYHRVDLDALMPDTTYVYRVAGDGVWSEWFQFRTAAEGFAPYRILYFGDAQNAILSRFSRVLRQAVLSTPDARLTLHAGDLIDRQGDRSEQWGQWFAAAAWVHASIPVLPAAGNHEYLDTSGPLALDPNWALHFPRRPNDRSPHPATVYTVVFQGVRYVVLDSSLAVSDAESAQKQIAWMEDILANDTSRWRVVMFHHPLQSVSHGVDEPILTQYWKPAFQAAQVDLVLQGHDHSYGRVSASLPDSDQRGTPVYLVSVAGAKMNLVSSQAGDSYEIYAEDLQLYQSIHFEENRLHFSAYTGEGSLFDAFFIERDENGNKRVVADGSRQGKARSCSNPSPMQPHTDSTGRSRPGRCWLDLP